MSANEELDRISKGPPPVFWEQLPLLSFGTILFMLLALAEAIVAALPEHGAALLRLYWAGFAWSAVQMLACLAIACVIITTNHGFLRALRGTKALASVRASTLKILAVSFILMATALPLIVSALVPVTPLGFWFVSVAVWVSLFAGCAVAFGRLIRIFFTLAVVDPNDD